MLKRNTKYTWKIKVIPSKNIGYKLEIKPWGLIITLPEGSNENEIYRIIEKHKAWIEEKHTKLLKAIERSRKLKLTSRSRNEFRNMVKKLVEKAANEILGLNPCKVVIRKMKTRWASCSPKGTITINALASYLPKHLITYIIYHELCHILEPKHNREFRKCLEKHYPNYKELEEELLAYEIKLSLHEPEENV